jgi:hypothetical protein
MIDFRLATPDDAARFAPCLRAADVAELRGVFDLDTESALRHSIALSKWAEAAFAEDGAPLALYGLGVWPSGAGCPWLVATDFIRRVSRRQFMFHTQHIVSMMCADTPAMANFVSADNAAAKRWLKWAGFTIQTDEVQLRPGGILFNPFFRHPHV